MGKGLAELTCTDCGARRYTSEGSVCIMTLGCKGKMQKAGHTPRVDGELNGIKWTQQSLFEGT